jgi:MFS transporter, Spinster family, sphingosine-1-phosphate transporter
MKINYRVLRLMKFVSPESTSYKWFIVGLLFSVAALNYADRTAFTAVFPLLKQDLGMSDVGLAAIGSFFLWSYALSSPLAGYLGDRVPRSRLVVWSLTGWSLITGLTGLVTSANQLLGMRLLLGIAESLYIPAAIALIADYHSEESRGTAMGVHLTGLHVGIVGGGTLAGYLGQSYGWRLSLFGLGGAGMVLALICHLFLKDARGSMPLRAESMKVPRLQSWSSNLILLLRIPSVAILMTEAMLLSIGVWIFANWLPLYFRESFGLTLGEAGFYGTFVVTAGAVFGVIVGGGLSDRVARTKLSRRMLLQATFYLASAPTLTILLWTGRFDLIAISIFLFSFLKTVGQSNANPMVCDLLPPRLRASAVGVLNMLNCLAGGLGVLLTGYLKRDYGLSGIFVGVSMIVGVAGLLVFLGYFSFIEKDLRLRSSRLKGPDAVLEPPVQCNVE